MTSFMHLNVKDYVLVCICCTSQSGALLKFSSCKHAEFLANLIKSEIDLKNMYICNICHNMLKKIEVFKQQVEESTAVLLNQVPMLKINKLHNFQCSPVEIDSVLTEIAVEVKPEYSEFMEVETVEVDVKVESEAEDNETELVEEMKRTKRRKTKSDSKFEGKIRIVMLTEQEVKEDRARMAKREGYLKLPYKCEDCIVGFEHDLTLVSHIEKRHRKIENGFQCTVCKCVTSNKLSHGQHMKTHIRRLECMVCHKRYHRMQSAVQHYDEQHAPAGAGIQQGYTCKECGFTTTIHRAYRYHLEKHKKHSCNICSNVFANRQALKTHKFNVHKESSRMYKCEACNKLYRSRTGLEAHERSVHTTTDTRAFCVSCNTYYNTVKGLQQHLTTHSKHVGESDKRFICDDCGAKFATKCSLQMHIFGEHFKINMHRCPKCTKIFKSFSNLNRHVAYVHNKKKLPRDKVCDYCGRAFFTQSNLQSHIRKHTGERPFNCTKCPATFAHSGALYNHNKLLHTTK